KFYVKDSEGNKVSSQTSTASLYSKFTEYVMKIPVQLKPNCNSKYGDGDYIFVVEGLNSSDEMSFKVEGKTASLCDNSCDSDCDEEEIKKKLEYSIDSIPEYVNVLDKFDVSVKIENNYGADYDFEIVGYLYRGSKHYSDEIVKNINVPHKGVAIINFRNKIGKLEPGDYKYKIKIKREGLKTYKHLNSDVTVEGPDAEIKSFYTKATEPEDEIKLYANVEGGDFKTVLETFYTTIETGLTGDLIFPVKVFEGKNVFFLKLVNDEGSIIDVKQLVVDVGETELESYEEKINLYSEEFLLSEDFELESTREEIIYLSSSEKAKNLIPYLIIALTVVVCIMIVLRKD
ncbi:MAG: hypothetical protein U9R08_04555, partial [Nanoarchaeota archaeon]|nr:hypothetical protein [Nanoarchaeota archaeon]